MKTFDKYGFISDLKDFLTNEINNGFDADIYGLISEYIENEIIYYADCWDICKYLNANDFTAFGMECKNITQLAYCALDELINEELNFNEIETSIEEKTNQ